MAICKDTRCFRKGCDRMLFKLAQLQMPVFEQIKDAVDCMEDMGARAVHMGAGMIALPEMFACPYAVENFPQYAQEEQGAIVAVLQGIC